MSSGHLREVVRPVNQKWTEFPSPSQRATDPETITELVDALRSGGHMAAAVVEGLNYLWKRGKLQELAELLTDIQAEMQSPFLDRLPRSCTVEKYLSRPQCDRDPRTEDAIKGYRGSQRLFHNLITRSTLGKMGSGTRNALAWKIVEMEQSLTDCERPDIPIEELRHNHRLATVLEQLVGMLSQNLKGMSDTEADQFSTAWEIAAESKGRWPAEVIHQTACKRVSVGRHLDNSTRSIDSPRRGNSHREEIDVGQLFGHMEDPARIAGAKLDYQDWVSGLPPLYRRVAEMATDSWTTKEIATQTHVTERRIRQIRHQLEQTISQKIPE